MTVRIAALAAVFSSVFSFGVLAQAPATPPPPVPADVSPLYVVTYIEVRPNAKDEGAALVKAYRDASRAAKGNLRAVAVQRMRAGHFVLVSAWQNKAAWDAAGEGTKMQREKLHAIRNAPTDDRFHNALTVGPMDLPAVKGGLYLVSHVDVIPPQKDNAIVALKALGDANRAAAATCATTLCSRPTARITSPSSRSGARGPTTRRTACRRTSASSATSSRR